MNERDQHTDAPENGDAAPEETSAGRRWLRYALWALGGLVALVVVLVVAFLLVLQTNWGAAKVGDLATDLANPFDDAEIEIGAIDGNWLRRLSLQDVRLVRVDSLSGDTVRMVQLDSLGLRYDLLALFNSTIHVHSVGVRGLDVAMHQQADSTWDLLQPFSGPSEPDTAQSAFAFQVDDITVEDTRFAAQFYAPGRDSTLRVTRLDAQIDSLLIAAEETRVDLDALDARFTPPGDTLTRSFGMSLALAGGRLDVRRLGLDSPYSDLTAEGTLALPAEGAETVEDVDFTLAAQPLDFRDLAGFVPALDPSKSLTLQADVTGSGRLLNTDVDAELSDGATLALTGRLTPDTAGPLTYDVQGQVRRLNPAFFTADTSAGLINADFAADLEGAQLDQLSGTASARVFDTRYGAYQLGETTLDAQFTDGQVDFDGASGLRGTRLTAEGTARPFDAVPSYDAEARFAGFDLGRFAAPTDTSGQQSDLTGALRVAGEGIAPATADLTAAVQLAPSTLNRYQIDRSRIEARLSGGDLTFDADLNSPQGGLAARGTAQQLTSDAPRFAITEGELQGVDVAALTGNTTRSQITGRFSLRGQGGSAETLQIESAQLNLRNSYYGPYEITSTDLTAALRDQHLRASGSAQLADAGTFRLDATARPFDAVPSYAVSGGSFENVDIGALAQDTTQSSNLNGTFQLDGRGSDPQTLRLTAEVALSGERLNRQPIDSAQLDIALQNGELTYDGQLTVPEGQTQLAGRARPFDETLSFALEEGRLRGLDLGALAGLDGLATDLNANVQLSAQGTDPRTATLDAQIDFDESQINDAQITGGGLQMNTEGGQARLDGEVTFAQGRLTLEGTADLQREQPRYDLEGAAENLDLAALAGIDTLDAGTSLRFAVEGEGTNPATMTLDADVRLDQLNLAGVTARNSTLDARLSDGLLRVDSLRLRSNVLTATGGGQIALFDTTAAYPSDFRLSATARSLTPLEPLLGAEVLSLGSGRAELRIAGPPGTVGFEADASLSSLVYDDIRLAGFDLAATGQLSDSLTVATAETTGNLAYLSLPSVTAENTDFDLTYTEGDELAFDADAVVDEDRELRLAGAVSLRPDNPSVRLSDFDLRLGEDRWALLLPATVSYGDEYRVSNFLLSSEDQQVAVDGTVDLDGPQSLVLTIENFDIGAVADLADFQGLGGRLNGSLSLTGAAAAPEMDGLLTFDISSYDDPVGDLRLALDYADRSLGVDAVLTHRDSSRLSIQGGVPMDLRLDAQADSVGVAPELLAQQQLDLAVTADAFSIGWVRPFLDPAVVDRIRGKLTGDLQITGTPDAPELMGEAQLKNAELGLAALGVTYDDLRADLEFTSDQIILREARMQSDGDGRLTVEGTINLAALTLGEYDLDIRARDFRAMDNELLQVTSDADLRVQGTTERPELTGDVELISANIFLTDEGAANPNVVEVALSEEDLETLQERFGVRVAAADTTTLDTYEAMAMDLDVEMQRDVWLRSESNPDLDVQFTGSLDVQKEAFEEVQVFGTIEVIPERSRVEQFGKRFSITAGTLNFNGPATDPVIDLEAEYGVPSRRSPGSNEVTITLGVEGRLDDLDLALGSEPQMSQADIVSYIATGRPADQAFQGGGESSGGVGGAATDLAIGQVAGLVENLVGAGLGLDVIEIETDGSSGATFTAGKYVSPRFYVAVRQPLRSSNTTTPGQDMPQTQVTLEYELTTWLLARLTGGANTVRANLQFEYAY